MGLYPVFPIDGPVRPPGRMIGRAADVEALARVLGQEHVSQLLADERRTGKTSVVMAALDEMRSRGRIAIDCDLSADGQRSSRTVAGHLAAQARIAGIGNPRAGRRAARTAREILGRLSGDALRGLTQLLGIEDAADAAGAVVMLLGPADDGATQLPAVLRALQAHAVLADEPVVIFVDELQAPADASVGWKRQDATDLENHLAQAARSAPGGLVFCFAGSDSALRESLLKPGRPLAGIGARFELQPIAYGAWVPGLRARFGELGQSVEADALDAILDEGRGHPRRTMHICHHASQWARPNRDVVDGSVVENAIRDARHHPSWS